MIPVIRSSESDSFIKELKKRSGSVDAKVTESVTKIIKDVAEYGDEALRKFTKQFDGIDIDKFEVDKSLLRKGYENSKISSALEKIPRKTKAKRLYTNRCRRNCNGTKSTPY